VRARKSRQGILRAKALLLLGFHCTAWLKFYVVLSVIANLVFVENLMDEAYYLKAEFMDSRRTFRGIVDLWFEWDTNSYSYQCACLGVVLLAIALLFVITMLMETPFLLIPVQIGLLITFHSLLEKSVRTYSENIGTLYEIYTEMEEMFSHLRHYRKRDVWYTSRMEIHAKYEPVIRNGIFVGEILLCLFAEYFVERVMQFYNYEAFLNKLNRPFMLAYRRWKFDRMMAKRRSAGRERLARHMNAFGNYTVAMGDLSLRTAIGYDNNNDSMHTAILIEEERKPKKKPPVNKTY